ncbi:sensor histidine kinase, partial [Bacteroidales bacterium AH-315-I05]|nr:sensor histidine kinase [Bacteroidales bacterium AH-315-I05]
LLFNRHQLKESENFNKKLLVERQSRTKAIIEAQEDERKRIAKDLHDGIGQVLTSAKLSLQNTQGNNDNSVDESLAMIDTACEQVRRISHNMMPRVLEQNGLIPAIEGLLNSTLGNAAIEFDFEHFEVKKKYEPKIELGIFRIGQELIQNIIKHADANKVNIQLYQNKKQLVLMVEDTGKGFSTEEKSMGMGLASIITRAESLNGEANIESELNQFTRVTVRIPII